ncbi:MAG: aspartate 1-decarboxylase [Ignavibacteria bacterium]|nr:aspartate 1-decarboxylase [Bacteroidota bacterium]MBL7128477.1 aspartate 1-decarboxylase [Ignavibacteria bacterium]
MIRTMCKSKIQRATITQAELFYEGSLTLDVDLMNAADMRSYEKVQVVNINNGKRFETYLIPGESGSGVVCLNGPAARLGVVGDEIIIISYAEFEDKELEGYKPIIVSLDKKNKIVNKSRVTEPIYV